jgi:nucleoid-associated protein YgaU
VSDRIADPQAVCPFVAFDDDRDHRGPGPDHRHRCYAESPAAPRALAHQAAYCLATAFPGCPTFVDWARREAAPVRTVSQIRSLRDAAGAPRAGHVASGARPGEQAEASVSEHDRAASVLPVTSVEDESASVGPAEGALETRAAEPPEEDRVVAAFPEAPPFLSGRSARLRPSAPGVTGREASPDDHDETLGELYRERPARPPAERRQVPIGYAPVTPGHAGRGPSSGAPRSSRREHGDAAAPSWEEPRRFESYPSLEASGRRAIPRPLAWAGLVLVAGVVLFLAPFVLPGLIGDGDARPTPTPPALPTPTPAAVEPTPEPTPAEVVYVVQAGDTLSAIAASYGVTVDQILAANPLITDPNQIAIGDRIVIPRPPPSEIVGGQTPAP